MSPWALAGLALFALHATAPGEPWLRPVQSWRLAEPGRHLASPVASLDSRRLAVLVAAPGDEPTAAVAVIDLATGRPWARVAVGPEPTVGPFWLGADALGAGAAGAVWLWPGGGEAAARRLPVAAVGHVCAAAADGRRFACQLSDGAVAIVDARHGAVLQRLPALPGELTGLALNRGSELLLAARIEADGAGRLRCWSTATGAELAQAATRPVSCLALAGERLLSGGESGLSLWELPSLALVRRLDTPPVRYLAASPDGSLAAVAGPDEAIRLVALDDGHLVAECKVEGGPLGGVCFLGSSHLAVAAGDRLRLFELTTVAP